MFKVARTFNDATQGANPQRGYGAPGSGAQMQGDPLTFDTSIVPREPVNPTKGTRSWAGKFFDYFSQRGQPAAENLLQHRPAYGPDSLVEPKMFGGVIYNQTPFYDRGAAAYVPTFGVVYSNPIGAGVVANNRPFGEPQTQGLYENGVIWWTSQNIPTSVHLGSLTEAEGLAEQVGYVNAEATFRVG